MCCRNRNNGCNWENNCNNGCRQNWNFGCNNNSTGCGCANPFVICHFCNGSQTLIDSNNFYN